MNAKKLEELVLYIAQRSEDDPSFGATKLNKVLFFSDFVAYMRLHKPITGAKYSKLPYGPVPKAAKAAIKSLGQSGRAQERAETTYGAYNQRRVVALADADLSSFDAAEIAIVDAVIDRLRRMSATEVSDFSHQFAGWQLAQMDEEIPYFTCLIPADPPELTPAEVAWAQARAAHIQ